MSTDETLVRKIALKGILYWTIVLAAFLVLDVALLRSTIVFIPLIAAAVLLYASSVARLTLAGKYAKPLCRSLQILAVAVFFALLFSDPELRAEARGLGLPIFILGTVWAIHFISKAFSDLTGVATRALIIAALGNLYYSLMIASGVLFLPQLASIILIGFAAAAAFAFVGVLRKHSNPTLSFVGIAFSKLWNPALIGSAVAVIMTYLAFVRPSLLTLGAMPVTVIEWAVMCVAIFWLFRRIRSALRAEEAHEFGDGHKIAGALSYEKGDLEMAAGKIEEFVEAGRKDGLITLATMSLAKNGVAQDAVQGVISIIVNYEDEPEPPVILKWAIGDRDETNRISRRKAVESMLAAAVEAMGQGRGQAKGNAKPAPEMIIPAIVAD